jgi:hypothetical protein
MLDATCYATCYDAARYRHHLIVEDVGQVQPHVHVRAPAPVARPRAAQRPRLDGHLRSRFCPPRMLSGPKTYFP